MLDYIVELVVSEDEVITMLLFCISLCCAVSLIGFHLIDRMPFHHLLMYLCPALAEKDIYHRTKLRAQILSQAKALEMKISCVFKVNSHPLLCFLCSMLTLES